MTRSMKYRQVFALVLLALAVLSPGSSWGQSATISLDGVWQAKIDPENVGVAEKWFASELSDVAPLDVPGVIQSVFREYHGVAWYEREFATPENPNANGRTLLRFWQAEYRADVWLNGAYLGFHEGGEEAFTLDATSALAAPGESNRLAVRVLNATDEPIDGISMANIPRRNNTNRVTPGCGYASGGLVDSVELVTTPAARVADLQLLPNWRTGEIEARMTFENSSDSEITGEVALTAVSVDGGEFTRPATLPVALEPGTSAAVGKLVVPNFKLWDLNDPNLYEVTAELRATTASIVDRCAATCGFRDFRFENGYFRLNGKRVFVKCSHSGSDSPITHRVPLDPDLYRKDIISCKTMGFNMIRYIAGTPRRFQLDLCDRIGFLVYDECLAGWQFEACPEREARWDAQTSAMIRRDRNHPSVVIWGLLNETTDSQLVLHAANFLPKARELDPSRMIFLNSGSFDAFAFTRPKTANYAIWRGNSGAIMPGAIKNETARSFIFDGSEWPAGGFFLHPGDVGKEYVALKWTAPADGYYQVDATFEDVVRDGQATVDLHFMKESGENVEEFWRGALNLNGAGKKIVVSSERLREVEEYYVFADWGLMKQAKVSSIAFFEALRALPVEFRIEQIESVAPIRARVKMRGGASIQEVADMTVIDRNGETKEFSLFGRVERIAPEDDVQRIDPEKTHFKRGDAFALVVGIGDGQGFGDTTKVDLRIIGEDGVVYDAGNEFSTERNPNGVWSYGRLPAGDAPNLANFKLFELGQKTLSFEPIGRFSNPDATVWQNELADVHPYKPVPHTAAILRELREYERDGLPVFLSEYGIGSAVDLWRLTRYYEQYGAEEAADAKHYRSRYDRFMADWNAWNLDEVFASPEQFFQQAIARMAEQRRIGVNAIRSNPRIVGHSLTGTHDQGISGEGLTTIFRELKPGTVDAMAEVFAPLRFCNFVEPSQAYVGQKVRVQSSLVDEDRLPPGDYPVRFYAVGPRNERLFDKMTTITIPEPQEGVERPFATPVFEAEFVVPTGTADGECRFYAEIQQGAAASGSERFFVFNRRAFPKLGDGKVYVWGDDQDLLAKLRVLNIDAEPYGAPGRAAPQFHPGDRLIVGRTTDRGTRAEFDRLYDVVRSGIGVLFLSPEVFAEGEDATGKLPFATKGSFDRLPNWLYHKDDWARRSSAFDGLQSGCVLDYAYYCDVIPVVTFKGQAPAPTSALAGAFSTQMDYDAGLSIAEWKLGKGKMILSTWLIQENLPSPIAERLLRNLLNRCVIEEDATAEK